MKKLIIITVFKVNETTGNGKEFLEQFLDENVKQSFIDDLEEEGITPLSINVTVEDVE